MPDHAIREATDTQHQASNPQQSVWVSANAGEFGAGDNDTSEGDHA